MGEWRRDGSSSWVSSSYPSPAPHRDAEGTRDRWPDSPWPWPLQTCAMPGTSSLPSLGPPVLLGQANSKGLKLSLPLSCPVAAVRLPWDCCRAESCCSFYDASLREQPHQPQRQGETANGQHGVKLPTLPRVPMEAETHRNNSTEHIK